MSEINNIKTTGQLELNASRNLTARDNRSAEPAQSQSVPTSTVGGSDKVSLTDTAGQLQSLQKIITELPEVNSDRVAELRAAIADGSYKVDATELAQNMINFENQLG